MLNAIALEIVVPELQFYVEDPMNNRVLLVDTTAMNITSKTEFQNVTLGLQIIDHTNALDAINTVFGGNDLAVDIGFVEVRCT